MSDLGLTKKLCPNGHLMDPAWDVCPYCPSDRRGGGQANAETIANHSRQEETMNNPDPGPELAKTMKIQETEVRPPPSSPRRTEIMDRPPTIEGVAWLVGVASGHKGSTHRIASERATVGMDSSCDVVIDHDHVSDRHASIRFRDGEFVITDLDSTNGTFVNDEEAHQHALSDGDRVRFGSSEWVFKCVLFDQ
jgi:hypothetical protein